MKGKNNRKKTRNRFIIIFILAGIGILGCGIWIGKFQIFQKEGSIEERNIFIEYRNQIKEGEGKRSYDVIEEKQERFLEEHLYGQWRFSERIVEIVVEGMSSIDNYNLTREGMKELKEMVIVEYQSDLVRYPLKEGQHSFKHPGDMWLYGAYGGFTWGKEPVYFLKKMNTNQVALRNIIDKRNPYSCEVYIPEIGMEDFIQVTYTLRTLEGGSEYLGYQYDYFGSHIYIDPNDTETIYIDFCGLWKMVRNPIEKSDLNDVEKKQEEKQYKEQKVSMAKKEKKQKGKREEIRAELSELERGLEFSYERREGCYFLTEGEKDFLKEHLYGFWRFSKRVLEQNEIDPTGEKIKSNFSYLGRETIKNAEWIRFEEEKVERSPPVLRSSAFSNASDIYLYGAYGGFSYSNNPVFCFEKMESGIIYLNSVFYEKGYDKVQADWMQGFVHITYFTLDSLEETRRVGNYFANHIYIDPNDTETIYIDFCGLWEMKRYRLGDVW